jgi:hypothetical protein
MIGLCFDGTKSNILVGWHNQSTHTVDVAAYMDDETEQEQYDHIMANILGFVKVGDVIACIVECF